MNFPYQVPESKKIRLIINTDAKNEADDQYAIAHALLTPRFNITGIIAAHFGTRIDTSMEESFKEIKKVLQLMDMDNDISVYEGAKAAMTDELTPTSSAGSDLIVREAMKDGELPLYVIFLGPLTDLAAAYLQEPRIADRMTAVWIGGGPYPEGAGEFNLENDIAAANVVFRSPIPLWQVPQNVYKMLRVSLAELAVRVRPHGEIGRYLFEQLVEFNMHPDHSPRWPKGEMWMLGDSPAVSLLIDDQEFDYDMVTAPHITSDMLYEPQEIDRKIRVYRSVDARFTLEDMYAKLELFNASSKKGG
ncbi:nucleoside hydrolase [Paenibacillus sp. FSL H8-0548]|uniref:nucleoside hydrolase n=1 Tax=Paenibacillus sp. FSL H8-0548 TaxID=1920422 RepID=UPI00096E6F3A|nr:nucleoside hydrolase [Paenibacillus sp. FSL H8-0548]OMF30822.1 nucleoside hydrolase [Paenibacillus sp. FSL H8-0548]